MRFADSIVQPKSMVQFGARFYRAAAICSFISAGTTLCLIFLPRWYPHPDTLEGRLELIAHPIYTLRLWIYLFHPFFTFAAALGIAASRWRDRLAFVLPGILGFAVWAYTEALQQALALVANHYTWRNAAQSTADATVRNMALTQMYGFDAIWDSLYVLLLLGFIVANLFYSAALWRGSRLSRVLSALFLAAALLSVFYFLNAFGIANRREGVLDLIYPLLQPVARGLIGAYLWRVTDSISASAPA